MSALYIIEGEEKRERAAARIKALPVKDGEVWQVEVKPYQPRRSVQQNNRLHLIFAKVAEATGSDIDSVKLGYKAKFLPGKTTTVMGREVTIYPKTSKMTVAQLNTFMEQCETHAIAEFGILLGDGANYEYA